MLQKDEILTVVEVEIGWSQGTIFGSLDGVRLPELSVNTISVFNNEVASFCEAGVLDLFCHITASKQVEAGRYFLLEFVPRHIVHHRDVVEKSEVISFPLLHLKK